VQQLVLIENIENHFTVQSQTNYINRMITIAKSTIYVNASLLKIDMGFYQFDYRTYNK
jgi:hypothetical protein